MEIPKAQAHTPLMQQYWDIKSKHTDKILLFRMGDFYEMFFDDAIQAAPLLNIALTSRSKTQGQEVPMCGVPHHSVGPQINKLLAAGLKVAICDQIENPAEAKGIVKRAVTRVVTPGLVYDPETLDGSQSHFAAAVVKRGENSFDVGFLDASTGELLEGQDLSRGELSDWIQKFQPREVVIENENVLPFSYNAVMTVKQRQQTLTATAFLLEYARETQGADIVQTLRSAETLQKNPLKLSATTIRHLELFKRMDGAEQGTLFAAVNYTRTPMGARLLRKRLASPFASIDDIHAQLELVAYYKNEADLRRDLRVTLGKVGDLERKVARLSNPLCNARDLRALALSVQAAPEAPASARAFAEKILATLQEELPHSTKEGGLIRPGVNGQLDEYVDLSTHAQTKLSELEARERESTGIQSLKIKYNSVFGYSFEVTKANLDKVPSHFVRRQTLAQGERFVTKDLSDLEQKILSAQARRCELEHQIFADLKKEALSMALELLGLSSKVAALDVTLGWAQLAEERRFERPQFVGEGINLKDSRHAVLEQNTAVEAFVPNDVILQKGECLLLTGPNMAGKSTLMRQTALIAVLAQCGSFVPATEAKLPLFDQIFTRIGASDNLSEGLSTFMVEMTETAAIIKAATPKSLVILDEIGRGTSTYDGMSLAQAVLEHFVDVTGSYTLFATHYHELTELADERPRIRTGHMAINEHKGQLIFLRKLRPGPANRSYGIHVARQAGLPAALTARAQKILEGLAAKGRELGHKQLSLLDAPAAPAYIEEPFDSPARSAREEALENLLEKFKQLEVNNLTPLEALNTLSGLQKSICTRAE